MQNLLSGIKVGSFSELTLGANMLRSDWLAQRLPWPGAQNPSAQETLETENAHQADNSKTDANLLFEPSANQLPNHVKGNNQDSVRKSGMDTLQGELNAETELNSRQSQCILRKFL